MKKKLSALLLTMVLAVSFAACGTNSSQSASSAQASASVSAESSVQETEEETLAVEYPVTVTDQLGREVVIEEEPEKIVSGYYISTSLLIALGEKDNLVGVEAKADKRSIYKLSAPEITELPSVGTAKEFNLEGCAALEPDVVVIPAKLKDVIPSLEELGISVIAVNPENQQLLEDAVVLLGTVTDSMERAEALLSFTDEKMNEMKEAVKGEEAPVVYMAANSALLSTAGPEMYQSSLIENAGGVNAASDITDSYWAEISYEKLLSYNPQYIVLASDAEYTVESVLEDENLAECDAVVNGNVYQFPSAVEAWDSPVPASVLGNLYLASVLHSDKYTQEQYKEAVSEFYGTFYGFEVTEDLYD